jgi:hypothetical protein
VEGFLDKVKHEVEAVVEKVESETVEEHVDDAAREAREPAPRSAEAFHLGGN